MEVLVIPGRYVRVQLIAWAVAPARYMHPSYYLISTHV